MDGENFPYFFDPCSFPLNDSTSNVMDQPMQQYPHDQFSTNCGDQIDLASLLCVGSMEENPILPVPSDVREDDIQDVGCRNNYKGKIGRKRKYIPPRVAFHTRSAEDILDDGYKWRKYGQKSVKNSVHPRSYYRCTHHTCNVKKQIQRLSRDTSIVVTTYEGIHNHPCEKLMETLSPLLKQLQFLSRF